MYKIKLPNFEGPFDLLLYFIKRDELNIYDIPIARITSEFLKYIRLMKYFDLELAGEFLLMASTLMYIKAQMLLPRNEEEGLAEVEDPRTQLVQQLLEYKLFKSAASNLGQLANESRYIFYRNIFEAEYKLCEDLTENKYKNANIFDLINIFNKLIEKAEKANTNHIVHIFPIKVEDKIAIIKEHLSKKRKASFFQLTMGQDKNHIVATLLAILELIKQNLIIIKQAALFDDIIIFNKPATNAI